MTDLKLHVIFKNGTWRIEEDNRYIPIAVFTNKEKCISAAKLLAHHNCSDLVIHNADGTVVNFDSDGRLCG